MGLKDRIFYFDALRAFAIAMVILIHVSSEYNSLAYTFSIVWGQFGFMGVPLFFMISGALLINKSYEPITFLKRRFSRIFIPFIFWVIVFIILQFIFYKPTSNTIINIVFGGGWFTWFVWALIAIYLFIPVLNPFFEKYGMKAIEYFLILWALTLILQTFNLYPFKALNLNYFSGYIGFAVLGYYLANKKFKFNNLYMGILLFVISSVFIMYYAGILNQILSPCYLTIPVALQATGVFLIFKSVKIKSTNNLIFTIKKFIESISKCSYGMFFVHVFIIGFIFRLFDMSNFSYLLLPLFWILVVILSWLVILICNKIPILNKLIGVN